MKNINYQKIIIVAIIGILIYPSMVMASWWNPFSWFKKHTNTPIVEQTSIANNPVITEDSDKKTLEKEITKVIPKENKTTITKKKEEPKVVVPINTTPKVIPTPTTIIPPVQNTTPVESNIPIKLVISDITFNPTANSVSINWKTNIDSESKVLLDGKAYFSKNGVSKFHSTEINNLETSHSYTGTITALVDNAWDNKTFLFNTKYYETIQITTSKESLNQNGEPFDIYIKGTPNEFFDLKINNNPNQNIAINEHLKFDENGNYSYSTNGPNNAINTIGIGCDGMVDSGGYNECIWLLKIYVQYSDSGINASKTLKLYTGKKYNKDVHFSSGAQA